jgi:alkylated DNA repair dioxygenase AlkB
MNAPHPGTVSAGRQTDLFGAAAALPEGFSYQPDVLNAEEEEALADHLARLPFEPFDFHGYLANRRVVGFGHRYDYAMRQVRAAPPIPAFLDPLRHRIARLAGLAAEAFEQVLINEYRPGAGIGWHRDKPHFGDVAAVSLLAPCTLRFRRKAGAAWDRVSLTIEPRSAYLMTGPARRIWEHSVPPLRAHRYSITLRTLTGAAPSARRRVVLV